MQTDHEKLLTFLSTHTDLPHLHSKDPTLLKSILTTPTLLHTLISASPTYLSLYPVFTLTSEHIGKFVPYIGIVLSVTQCYACKKGVYHINDTFMEGNATHQERIIGMSEYVDAFYFTVQNMLTRTPRSVMAYVEGSEPRIGAKIKLWGVYRAQHDSKGYPTRFKTVFHVYHSEYFTEGMNVSMELNPIVKRCVTLETLVPLVAPTVYGHEIIKKALILQLLGGTRQGLVRSAIHVLLVGDPSVSKSMLLRFVSKTFDCLYASGKGVTNAGLTVSIVDKKIMPGALVLSDFVCCIDEFTQLDCLYEAMEQQSVSINKAGISMTIKIRCGVLAASNEIEVEEALKTRFDMVFVIKDTQEYDREIVSQVMNNHADVEREEDTQEMNNSQGIDNYAGNNSNSQVGNNYAGNNNNYDNSQGPNNNFDNDYSNNNNHQGINNYGGNNHSGNIDFCNNVSQRNIAYLKDYIIQCRSIQPVLTRSSQSLIIMNYLSLRRMKCNLKITPRTLESLIRLACAHAKLRMSSEVTSQDVDATFSLYTTMLKSEDSIPVKKPRIETERDLVIDCLLMFKESVLTLKVGDVASKVDMREEVVRDVLVELDKEEIVMFDGENITFIN